MKRFVAVVVFLASLSACNSSSNEAGDLSVGFDRSLAGGDTTSDDRTTSAFENPASNLSGDEVERFLQGDVEFEQTFVTAPAPKNPGLGPLFNNTSCAACHLKDGRGSPIFGRGAQGSQALIRVSRDDGVPLVPGGPGAVPELGTQIQDHAIFGVSAEAQVSLNWLAVSGAFADGETYELRRPNLRIPLPNGEPLAEDVQVSLRVGPPVFGLGLLEAIPTETILAQADPDDSNGDGISGRANFVWDVASQATVVGRFGRKANQSDLRQQAAAAYIDDMGVTNPIFRGNDRTPDIGSEILESVVFYLRTLAVPRARDVDDSNIQRGERLFKESGCVACHIQQVRTGEHPEGIAAVSNQVIFPYTDLLLHDMGEGLADNRSDFQANGREWRTPALWGIGATTRILGDTDTYLHDGRARTLSEAILWHGGEAETAKENFRAMSKADRDSLLGFLRSL